MKNNNNFQMQNRFKEVLNHSTKLGNVRSLITLFSILLLSSFTIISCGKNSYDGVVGNYYSITLDPPDKITDPNYNWVIIKTPQTSQLTFSDLTISETKNTLTFLPDQPGEYQFKVMVFDSKGEEKTSEIFIFDITDQIDEKLAVKPEETVSEVIAEDSMDDTESKREEFSAEDVYDTAKVALESLASDSKSQEYVEEVVSKPVIREKPKTVQPPKKPALDRNIPKKTNYYTIQYSSRPTLQEAQQDAEILTELGFDTYIQKAFFHDTDELWYRVRIGMFKSPSAAAKAAKEIDAVTNRQTWVDNVRLD